MKKSLTFLFLSASIGLLSANTSVDCVQISLVVKNSVTVEQSKVLEIVSKQVSGAPSCACEIVKAAIEASNANAETVAAIVEAAASAAPEHMRLIAQCAVAVAPDALGEVQAVLAKLDPNLGESTAAGESSKDSKDAKSPAGEVAAMPNPLDFPGQGPIGPTPGGPGGLPLIPIQPPVIIAPPEVSDVN